MNCTHNYLVTPLSGGEELKNEEKEDLQMTKKAQTNKVIFQFLSKKKNYKTYALQYVETILRFPC